MCLFDGDKITYRTSDGRILTGIVSSLSGDRIYLQDGGVTYQSYVIERIEEG